MLKDFLFAARTLRRSPGFTLIVVATLALGLGANTAIFSVVNAALLRALPYEDPDRLCFVFEDGSAYGFPRNTPTPANFLDWRAQSQSFADMTAVSGTPFNLTGAGEPERIEGHGVTASFFSVLGVQPVHGRGFTEDDDRPEATRVAVLSHPLWMRRFGGDPSIVGRTIKLNDLDHTVVGIMPPRFRFPGDSSEIWVPMAWSAQLRQNRGSHYLTVFGRLKPGVTVEQAHTEIAGIAKRLETLYPETNSRLGGLVISMREQLSGGSKRALMVLLGTVGFLLLIACSNVAGLMLARSTSRAKEMAVRAALGASTARLLRQGFIESLVLALLGGGAGLAAALWTNDILVSLLPAGMHGSRDVRIDAWVAVFAVGASLLTAILFGATPALAATRTDAAQALKQSARGTTGSQGRVRAWLVAGEVALALILLVGAGLMLRSFAKLSGVDPGFKAEGVLTLRVSLPSPRYSEDQRRIGFHDRALEQIRAVGGVESAAFINRLPMTMRGGASGIVIEGRPAPPGTRGWIANVRAVSPDYFRVMGIPLREGRLLNERDAGSAPPVRVINTAMARKFWPGESPVGKRFAFGNSFKHSEWITIAGVAGDVRQYALGEEPVPEMYAAIPQSVGLGMRDLVIRAASGIQPLALAGAVRQAIHSVDSEVPVSHIAALEDVVASSVADRRLQMLLLGFFAALAMILAAVGIYGVISYTVASRTQEIGVRMAIGADGRKILRMIVGQAMKPVAVGTIAGVIGALLLSRFLTGLVYEISTTDAVSFVLATLALTGVALLAAILPARRAVRVDPIAALRCE